MNKYQPHVLVLPEDDANRQLANGFLLNDSMNVSRIQVLAEAGGWREVLARFRSEHVRKMEKYANRFMVLLIDFDSKPDRFEQAKSEIPPHLIERVFIVGAWTEPEDFGPGRLEKVGRALAGNCQSESYDAWDHPLLKHNAPEVDRLRQLVRPILF